MNCLKDIAYLPDGGAAHTLDLWLPEGEDFPVLVYFHGGGFVNGDKSYHDFYADLTARGIAVASANYRLYPAAKYPDFITDAAAAVAWVSAHIDEYGGSGEVFVSGSSAGGYLTQMLCFDKRYLAAAGIDADAIAGYYMDAGQPTTHFNVLNERGLDTRRVLVDEAAPLYYIDGSRDYPPMAIAVSDNDMAGRPEQTALLVATLRHFGHDMTKVDYTIVSDSTHCAYVNKHDADGGSVFAVMLGAFVDKHRKAPEK